jgi:two-component system response regulator CpxR
MPNEVLVVDDNRVLCEMIGVVLRKAGLSVRFAHDGKQCLEAVGAQKPDVVVLDVGMPVMGGFQVLRELREDPETSLLPVVMLTGDPGEPGELAAWMGGVDRYLAKPCDIATLVSLVKELLPKSREK